MANYGNGNWFTNFQKCYIFVTIFKFRMDKTSKALLAMHERTWASTFGRMLTRRGYELLTADTVDEMKEHMGVSAKGVPQNHIDLYLMDANLGSPGSRLYEPAEEIFRLIKSDYDTGRIKYLSITGNSTDAEELNQRGIPCTGKNNTTEIADFIN